MNDQTKVFLTEAELAARWSVSRGHLANLRSRGEGLRFVKVCGSAVRYAIKDVERAERGEDEAVLTLHEAVR